MKEITTVLYENNLIRVEHIASHGQSSCEGFFYDVDMAERVYVTRGNARLFFENGAVVSMSAGDELLILPRQRHRVEFTSDDCEWICVYLKQVQQTID